MIQQPQMILFDLDGTLVDSVPDLAFSVDAMLERLGRAPCGESAVRRWVGNGLSLLVRRALTGSMEGEADEAEYARAYPLFLELYAQHNFDHSVLFSGVREGLDDVRAAGYPLGCVTNKASRFTEPLLRHLGLREYFGIVLSGDTLPKCKPDPLPLLHAAEFFGVEPTRSLMVGDSVNDVRAARAAGFGIVCTSYGYNHGQDIRSAEPDAVIDSMTELRDLISSGAAPQPLPGNG